MESPKKTISSVNEVKLLDNFVHSLLQRKSTGLVPDSTCTEYSLFKIQSKYDFGFVPLSQLVMPKNHDINTFHDAWVIETHIRVQATGLKIFRESAYLLNPS